VTSPSSSNVPAKSKKDSAGRGGGSNSMLLDLIDRILDKGIVIDAWARISVLSIELITVEARVVVASVETYLRYAEAIGNTALASQPPRQQVQQQQGAQQQVGAQQAQSPALPQPQQQDGRQQWQPQQMQPMQQPQQAQQMQQAQPQQQRQTPYQQPQQQPQQQQPQQQPQQQQTRQ